MSIPLVDFASKVRQVWLNPLSSPLSNAEQEMYSLFAYEDWTVIESRTKLVPWYDLWPLLLHGATHIQPSNFEGWIIAEFNARRWTVENGLVNNYGNQVAYNKPKQSVVTQQAAATPPIPASQGVSSMPITSSGPVLILHRTSGDFGSDEIAIHPSTIDYILPYGPRLGKNQCGCRLFLLQGGGAVQLDVQEDYGQVLAEWQEKLGGV